MATGGVAGGGGTAGTGDSTATTGTSSTGVSGTGTDASGSNAGSSLPRTASDLPLLAVLALLAFAGALMVRALAKARVRS
jgi:hypothetical protein